MKVSHYKKFFADRYRLEIIDSVPGKNDDTLVKQGKLVENATGNEFKIINNIPRFLSLILITLTILVCSGINLKRHSLIVIPDST